MSAMDRDQVSQFLFSFKCPHRARSRDSVKSSRALVRGLHFFSFFRTPSSSSWSGPESFLQFNHVSYNLSNLWLIIIILRIIIIITIITIASSYRGILPHRDASKQIDIVEVPHTNCHNKEDFNSHCASPSIQVEWKNECKFSQVSTS